MNQQQLEQIHSFHQWVNTELDKSVNFEVSYWSHSRGGSQKAEYRIWIEDTLNKQSKDLDELLSELPRIKEFCLMKKEFSL